MTGAERVMDISHDGMVRIAERINVAQNDFGKLGRELHDQLAGMQRDWQGQGGSAFGRLMIEWQERHGHITKLLQGFEDSLSTTQKSSEQQDSTQSASMFALSKHLNG
jgi:WXG100 family type VII secretion target